MRGGWSSCSVCLRSNVQAGSRWKHLPGCRRSSVALPAAGLDLLRLYGSFPSFAPDGESLSYISYPGMSGVSAVGLDGAEPRILAKVRTRFSSSDKSKCEGKCRSPCLGCLVHFICGGLMRISGSLQFVLLDSTTGANLFRSSCA